ncbi:isopentenyl-diphosphate Delta-isomerase [Azorhizobium doebereinerae]|uniref:isopentenyl-diphosphate Delta-isomerase n=1 Tax=Azorhizobium doebereinerae TaxID=281091 RepID=UPI00055722A9|nr:isopentenyl-diphosphate Delta-isomerase [Azorhizobium doebereinerae]
MASKDLIVLVDANDTQLGVMDKLQTHLEGARHRAVSGFLFSRSGEMLIQKRAATKYHSGGLWANACCSHPRPGEAALDCMQRRFGEELGISPSLHWFGITQYRCSVGNGLTEDEVVHGFAGRFDGEVMMNADEVEDWRWVSRERLTDLCRAQPGRVAAWLRVYSSEGFIDQAIASCR